MMRSHVLGADRSAQIVQQLRDRGMIVGLRVGCRSQAEKGRPKHHRSHPETYRLHEIPLLVVSCPLQVEATRARDKNNRLMVDTDPQPSGCGSGIASQPARKWPSVPSCHWPAADITTKRAYFHSQSLVLVFPSASALYSKTTA